MNRISIPSSLYRAIVTRAEGKLALRQQKLFTSDKANKKAALCTRRAGMSTGMAIDLLEQLTKIKDT